MWACQVAYGQCVATMSTAGKLAGRDDPARCGAVADRKGRSLDPAEHRLELLERLTTGMTNGNTKQLPDQTRTAWLATLQSGRKVGGVVENKFAV